MKVELTPLGRYKLSIGRLKPHHYRFFDNNVVYDSEAMGITEDQNDADTRIRENTPTLKQNPNITGVETMLSIIETNDITVQMDYIRYDLQTNEPIYYNENYETNYNTNLRKIKEMIILINYHTISEP